MPLPETEQQARKHFQDQDAPLSRKWHSRDPGLSQVATTQDVTTIVEREMRGEETPVFRARTSENLPDPVAVLQRAIRAWTGGMSADDFRAKFVHSTEDLTLYQILYGNMSDDKRAGHLNKLSKLTLEKQKEVLKQNNIQLNRQEKQLRNQQSLAEKLRDFKERSMAGEIVEAKSGDSK